MKSRHDADSIGVETEVDVGNRRSMNRRQFSLGELMLAVVFLSLAAALMSALEGYFFFHGLAMSVAVLFPAYLLAVLMLRHHFGQPRDGRKN